MGTSPPRPSAKSTPLLALVLTLLAAPLARGAVTPVQASGPAHIEEVRRALVAPDREAAVRRLVELGAQTVPTFWQLVSGQAFSEEELDLRAARELAEELFRLLPARDVVQELRAQVPADAPLNERLLLIETLAWTGSDLALHAAFEVLAEVDPIQLRSRSVPLTLERALPRLLTGSRRFRLLREELPRLPPALLPVLVVALDGFQRPEVSELFVVMAQLQPSLEPRILRSLGLNPRPLLPDASERGVDLARRYLDVHRPKLRRQAVLALEKLHDGDSFAGLVSSLDDDDRGVQRAALQAVQELSGLRRNWDADRWQQWLADEEDWVARSSELGSTLVHGDAHRAHQVLVELARHRLFAQEMVELVGLALENPDPVVRKAACRDLATRRRPEAVTLLIEALDDPSPEVRSAAAVAVTGLTGLDLGPGRSAWDAWWASLD